MNKLVVLTGPTAVGKTSLSIKLAKLLDTEIISADSMQVYKGMDIGTAKINHKEAQGVFHHLIDFLDPDATYNVYEFKNAAEPIIKRLQKQEKIPLIVGGTGFYIQALVYSIDFEKKTNNDYIKKLKSLEKVNGMDYIYNMLKEVDPKYCEITSKNNKKRIYNALCFYNENKVPLSLHNEEKRKKKSPYDLKYFVLTKDRDNLYSDINRRVDFMMQNGLLEEARKLYDMHLPPEATAAKAIGYYELFDYFRGKYDLDTAINKIKQDTRHFAKRQMTWFRREKNVIFINKEDYKSDEEILDYIMVKINE